MNERVWKLVGGFVTTMWKGISGTWFIFVWSAGGNAFAASRGWGSGIGWLPCDSMRAAMVFALTTGLFFTEREIVTFPVSRKDVWRAKWLLATAGMTALSASARAAAVILAPGPHFDPSGFIGTTAIEFLSAGTCAACAAFLLKTPDLVAMQSGVLRWVAGITWLSMPLWCTYLRLYGPDATHAVTPVFAASVIGLAIVTVYGFRVVPVANFARLSIGADARRDKIQSGPTQVSERARTRADIGPQDGVVRWAVREILWGAGFGLCCIALIAVLETWMPLDDAPQTFVRALSGMFATGGGFGPWTYAVPAILWLTRIVPSLRLLRSVPISTWTLVRVMTVAQAASWVTMWMVQAGAYRWSEGVWPSSPTLSTFFVVLAVLAASKTVLLLLGGRYFIIGAIVVLQTSIFAAMRFGLVTALPVIPAAVLSISIVSVLMLADLQILMRTNRLYRPSTSVV